MNAKELRIRANRFLLGLNPLHWAGIGALIGPAITLGWLPGAIYSGAVLGAGWHTAMLAYQVRLIGRVRDWEQGVEDSAKAILSLPAGEDLKTLVPDSFDEGTSAAYEVVTEMLRRNR